MLVTVGRIGRPHGVRGEVTVEVRTDEPERRFAIGSRLATDLPHHPEIVITGARWHQAVLLLTLEGIEDRSAAESVRNAVLSIDVDAHERPEDDDEFYDHQLLGMRVVTVDGNEVGEVIDVVHLPAQDLLIVSAGSKAVEGAAAEVFIPFVREIVPNVDVQARVITVDPPPGLLDLDAQEES
jgi:16S rRNA processing protein RimM